MYENRSSPHVESADSGAKRFPRRRHREGQPKPVLRVECRPALGVHDTHAFTADPGFRSSAAAVANHLGFELANRTASAASRTRAAALSLILS